MKPRPLTPNRLSGGIAALALAAAGWLVLVPLPAAPLEASAFGLQPSPTSSATRPLPPRCASPGCANG